MEERHAPCLKDPGIRIDSMRSTRKITAAMKMVAASKLRRAEEQALAVRKFVGSFEDMTDGARRPSDGGGKRRRIEMISRR